MDKFISLQSFTAGFWTPQGLSAIQHKADPFTEIDLIPGQLAVVRKKSRVDGSISVVEIFAGNTMFWEYTVKAVSVEETPNPS